MQVLFLARSEVGERVQLGGALLVGFVRNKTSPEAKVVLLVDSMERLSGIGEGAKKVFDSVENLFGHHRGKLRFATLSTVYFVPPYISAVVSAGDSNLVYSLPLPKVFESPLPLHREGKRRRPHEEGGSAFSYVTTQRGQNGSCPASSRCSSA